MFLLGLLPLTIFIIARPFDLLPALRGLPFLYVFFAVAVLGFLGDLAGGRLKLVRTPQLGWAAVFLAWCILTTLIWDPGSVVSGATPLFIAIALFYLIGHGITTPAQFRTLVVVLLGCLLWVSFVCSDMAQRDTECVAKVLDEGVDDDIVDGVSDGRRCEERADCYEGISNAWSVSYKCEYVGMFDITSIERRVRYVGVLHDPNESALAVCLGLPLAIALHGRWRKWLSALLVAITGLLVIATVVYSQSRGGQIVLVTVLAVYFIRRFGMKGVALLAVAALPVVLIGGRSGGNAEGSTMERLECQFEGIQMFVGSPIFGVGYDRFTEFHYLTAHNSYVLAPAELGFVGMLAWSVMMYISWKIPLSALRWTERYEPESGATLGGDEIERWAVALLAMQAGIAVGTFFLSFNYHFVLWIHFGLIAAFYSVLRRLEPDYAVRIRPWEIAAVGAGSLALLAAVRILILLKLGF